MQKCSARCITRRPRTLSLVLLLCCQHAVMPGCHAEVNGTASTAHRVIGRMQSNSVGTTNDPAHPPHSMHRHQQQRQRKLVEGLECDLQIYKDFIASEEGQNTFIMATMCESRILYLKNVRAGYYGPVEQDDLRLAMCSEECLQSDALHQLAMSRSRCSCAQVSATTFVTYDFCLESSARLLCTHLGECGHWDCELDDFMCLRYEWDKLYGCGSRRVASSMALLSLCFLLLFLLM